MNRRKIIYIFLCCLIIAGVAISFDTVRQNILYHSIRLWQGKVLKFDCYTVQIPINWNVHVRENRKDNTVYTLRKYNKHTDSYIFISILPDFKGDMLKHSGMKEKTRISVKGQEYVIYELTALATDNNVRLFSKFYNTPFILIGESSEIIKIFYDDASLMTDIVKSTCN